MPRMLAPFSVVLPHNKPARTHLFIDKGGWWAAGPYARIVAAVSSSPTVSPRNPSGSRRPQLTVIVSVERDGLREASGGSLSALQSAQCLLC